jgi:tRNA A37 threonylcarbamoyladenosine synthetase subunit TsaC/SUA5/YrdC
MEVQRTFHVKGRTQQGARIRHAERWEDAGHHSYSLRSKHTAIGAFLPEPTYTIIATFTASAGADVLDKVLNADPHLRAWQKPEAARA